MEDEPNYRSGRSLQLDARLPVVVCNPELKALKDVGLRLKCDLFDILFAVFGLAVREVGASSFSPRAIWSADTARTDVAGQGKIGYAVSLPRAIWSSVSPQGAVSCFGVCRPADGAVAFIHRHEPEEGGGLHARIDRQTRRDQTFYAPFDLIAEVTESEQHVLIECFFRSAIVNRNAVARLLFRYLEGVKDAGKVPVHG